MRKILILTLTALFLSACSGGTAADNDKPNLAVTTTFINDMVAVLENGVDGFNTEMIIPAGEDPHVYEPKASDLRVLGNADVTLYHGLNFEGRMTAILTEGVSITEDFQYENLEEMEEEDGTTADPHFWFDIGLYKQAFTAVKDTLIKYNPGDAGLYEQNYKYYITELDELDQFVTDRINEIPEDSRMLITPHDAFGYLESSYDIEVHAPQGFSTDSEVSNNQIQATAKLIADNNIKSIFVETTTNPDRMTRLKEIVRSQGGDVEVVSGEDNELLSDSLAPEGSPGDTYIDMYRHNINIIADHLK
ncbi:metal transporter [Jeotgalicoccus coquinae]|uniref:Manganese/zinc/iron transport system substrate-binding protein n=1 Tax=Jeotgalicoccus coquinae TaxID=709509 RepID=A0A6V7R4U7_9STAP|nr:zinc ABC transporter substrate-binding protein [Jeotgalicoccus coquinae]MBB6423346.1 manganese/zinc/iron transport system substrate-binding protein [Jeotgalicoccus coquinae]GGE19139.1 metal transporter [Jeotgalicoccus coquinae]CAD2071902.1 Periplasmic zinc-binding protein TroA precursor [Jeotgalicoccus coquinae]